MMEIERSEEEEGEEEEEGLVELLLSSPSCTNYSSSMFCYGGDGGQETGAQKSSDSSSLSTLSSSPSSNSITTCSKVSIKEEEINGCMRSSSGGSKKAKKDGYGSKGTIKVRKERLGDRIAALQQLVSPFGKSDTASVLHEALAYIRFLHEQVQVLSSPYLLQRLPSSASLQGKEEAKGMKLEDLQSRGLCLVPLTCTMQVPNTNGADLWAPSHSNFTITEPTTSSPPNPSP